MVLPLRNKSLRNKKISNNMFVREKDVRLTLDGHVAIDPCLFKKQWRGVTSMREFPEAKEWCMAKHVKNWFRNMWQGWGITLLCHAMVDVWGCSQNLLTKHFYFNIQNWGHVTYVPVVTTRGLKWLEL